MDGGISQRQNLATPTTEQYRQLFFQSPPLPPGNHFFQLTNVIQNDWLWLDYFDITTDLSSSSTISAQATTTASTQATTTTSSQVTDQTQNNSQPSSNHPPIGAIVGGTLGGIAAICALVFCFLYLRRRHRPPSFSSPGVFSHSLIPFSHHTLWLANDAILQSTLQSILSLSLSQHRQFMICRNLVPYLYIQLLHHHHQTRMSKHPHP